MNAKNAKAELLKEKEECYQFIFNTVPALIAVGILQGIGYWNDYFTIYMYAPEKATIAYGIQKISSDAGVDLPKVFAAMMFSILPVVLVFACFQKTIMNNTAVGGIKG